MCDSDYYIMSNLCTSVLLESAIAIGTVKVVTSTIPSMLILMKIPQNKPQVLRPPANPAAAAYTNVLV